MEDRLLTVLASIAPALANTSHNPARPDLFGQAYRHLFDATFRWILSERNDLAERLFPITIDVADRARIRLGSDLSQQRLRERTLFGTEPFVDMMELSGYALLMSHVEPPGISDLVRATWDTIFSSTTMPDLAGALAAVLSFQENTFALTNGGIGRTSRQMQLARVFRERGIVRDFGTWGHQKQPAHPDPVVAVFAPDDLAGISYTLADLFFVEYLAGRPEMADHEEPRGARWLREALDHEQARRGDDDPSRSDEEDGL